MKIKFKLICIILTLSLLFSSTAFAQNQNKNIVIYYPNGDWKYTPVELVVPDDTVNQYLVAINSLVKGEKMPKGCYDEFPDDFNIDSFEVKEGIAYVDIKTKYINEIDEKVYSFDVLSDILTYNIFSFDDQIEEVIFLSNGKLCDKFTSGSKKEFFGAEVDPEVEKLVQEKIKLVQEKVKNMTPEQISELVKQKNNKLKVSGLATDTVVIDPGHGGTDPGAVATYNGSEIYEKNINLAIALAVRDELLYHGYNVLMTRTTDVDVSYSTRYNLANNNNATCFVSVHCNSFETTTVKGTTCVYPNNHDITQSHLLADIVHDQVLRYTDFVSYKDPYKDVRNLLVLRYTTMPAIITETGFMSNASDLAYLVNSSNQDTIGHNIGYGTYYWMYWFS